MQHTHERRVSGVRRVSVERLVDICGSSDPSSAFQGRSVDISGRGMQVRAAHLPQLRSTVVLRFEEQGTEVLAEGEVAWRRACASGGEFGVRFTALDSRSVQTLKALCGVGGLEDLESGSEPEPETSRRGSEPEPARRGNESEPPRRNGAGSRPAAAAAVLRAETDHDTDPAPPAALGVRLHIAGLSSPLHAQIKGQGSRSLEVGSQLEFLRVGRPLEIEDLAHGGRRSAVVEAVQVNVDQKSRVPELLVSVRYSESSEARPAARGADGSRTPEPQRTIDARRGAEASRTPEPQRARTPEPQRTTDARRTPEPQRTRAATPSRSVAESRSLTAAAASVDLDLSTTHELSDESDGDESERDTTPPPLPLRAERQEPASVKAASRSEASDAESNEEEPEPTDSTEALLQRLDGLLGGVSVAARAAGVQVARWGGSASQGAGWLLGQARSAMQRAPRPAAPRRRTTAAPRAALRSSPLRQNPQLAVQRPRSADGPSVTPSSRRVRPVLWSCVVALVAVSIGYMARRTPVGTPVPAAARVALLPSAPVAAVAAGEPSQRPLAPSDPPPNGAVPLASRALASAAALDEEANNLESSEMAAARGNGPDALPPGSTRGQAGQSGQTSDEFGQGRLHLPVIYRLRLDDGGGALRGERTPNGFEITVPGRRVMESGSSITKREPRISKVSTHNTSQGTRISFRFRDTIPAYKVRLRKDYIEFWISGS